MTLNCTQSHADFTWISLAVTWYFTCRQELPVARESELTAALTKVEELQALAALSKEAALALSADAAVNSTELVQTCALNSNSDPQKIQYATA